MSYEEFNTVPEWQQAQWDGDRLMNKHAPAKWSGADRPPDVGSRVKVLFNNLGSGTVKGYFIEYGWLGLLVALDNPPKWRTNKLGGNPLAHIFGVEYKLELDRI